MYRVVTKRFDHYDRRIIERGPWHVSRQDAESWASILKHLGYHVEVESQQPGAMMQAQPDDDLRNALASMA